VSSSLSRCRRISPTTVCCFLECYLLGAKLGANSHRCWAVSGVVRRLSLQVGAM
jgi:hypothetical protein